MSERDVTRQNSLITEDGEVLDDRVAKVRTALEGQHAIHGIFGSVFERLGGEELIYRWAKENEGRFITLLTNMTPGLQPTQALAGDINLHIHASLNTTDLDTYVDETEKKNSAVETDEKKNSE